jgi:hypothetical protein
MHPERTFITARTAYSKVSARRATSGRWPILWTLVGALAVSLALWWLIFAGAGALIAFAKNAPA